MNLSDNCYYKIAEYLINPNKQYITAFFHKIFNIFKNSHKDFLKIVVNYYIRSLQILYQIDVNIQLTDETKYMIQDKILSRIMKKNNIDNHTELKDFRNNNDIFEYKNIRAKKRKIIYFLAIFNGYIWYSNIISSGVDNGYEFEKKLRNLYNKKTYEKGNYIFKLKDLQKNKLACIDFFELYKLSEKKGDNLYIAKDFELIFYNKDGCFRCLSQAGMVWHIKDLKLIKIF